MKYNTDIKWSYVLLHSYRLYVAICIANYTNDIVSNIWFSKSALGHRNGLKVRVYGEIGSAEWYQLEPENLYYNDNKGHKIVIDRASVDVNVANENRYNRFKAGHPSGFIEAFANYYTDIAMALDARERKKNNLYNNGIYNIDVALEGLKMMEALVKSSKEKSWVKISE